MRGIAPMIRALWVALVSALLVVGCGGDSFETAPASPGPGADAGGEDSAPDSPDAAEDTVSNDASDATEEADASADVASDADDGDVASEADAPTPGLSLAPDPLDFGEQQVGLTSSSQELTIFNSGQAPLSKPALTFMGAHPGDFAVASDDCPTTGLAAGASCSAFLRFTPAEAGAREATIIVLAGSEVQLGIVKGTGFEPGLLAISPPAVDFGTVMMPNASNPIGLKVSNLGGSVTPALTTIVDPASAPFVITGNSCVGTTLAPNTDCYVSVIFKPPSVGTSVATLRVGAAGLNEVTTTLTGTSAAAGALSMSPTSADLGQVTVGAAGAIQYFSLTNQGTETTGNLLVQLKGTNAQDFVVESNGCSAPLAEAQTCVIGVRLAPASEGAKIATLEASATPGGTATASLNGKGLQPASLAMVPAAQDFGTVAPTQSSASFTFIVENRGETVSGAVIVSKDGPDSTHFEYDSSASTCNAPLQPGATCSVVVRFKPTSDGAKTAVIHATAAPGGDAAAALTGFAGTPALAIAPTTWDFGSLELGTPSTIKQFTVTNSGTVKSGIPNVVLAQAGTADFTIVSHTCSTQLAPQATCVVDVRLTPSTSGSKAATLQVSADPGGSAVASLQGRGLVPPQLTLTPSSADFGTIPLQEKSTPRQFTLTNVGEVPTSDVTINLGAPNPGDFSFTTTCAPQQPLAGGVSCSIVVTFEPTATQVRQSTIVASATIGGQVSSSLTGVGTTQAVLSVAPTTLDYGNATIGQTPSPANAFTVTNNGGASSGPIQILLGDTTNYSIPPPTNLCAGVQLAAGASCNVTVLFTPQTAGKKDTSLTAQATPGGTATATLTGYGVGPALLNLTPALYDFGTAQLGTSSAAAFFNLTNNGGSTSGAMAISIVGAGQSSFQLGGMSADPCTPGGSLAPGATCQIGVVFAPTSYGAKTATLNVTASPGGTAQSTLKGGTPDIFVSRSGNNSFDGRTPSTAVLTITKGLALALPGWNVHVAMGSTTYGAGETWPLEVKDGKVLFGDVVTEPYPIIEPLSAMAMPATLVRILGVGSVVDRLELRSGTTVAGSTLASRTVVLATGTDSKLTSSIVRCQEGDCTAINFNGPGTGRVTGTTAVLQGSGTALKASATSGGVVRADYFSALCPESADINIFATLGIDATSGLLNLTNSIVDQCMQGVKLTSNATIKLRDSQVTDSGLYGVVIDVTGTPMNGSLDLGTASSSGNNTLRSTRISSKVGLSVRSQAVTVNAAGNTWVPNLQGADASGKYPTQYRPGPILEPAVGSGNYSITYSSSGIQF